MNKIKNMIYGLIAVVVVVIILGVLLFLQVNNKEIETDNIKFAKEYTLQKEDNVFVYKSADEIINILEHGTGVVYLGFPECPWCQQYTVYLNDVARQNGIDKIYYYNIKEDRANNTEEYQKIVSILGDNLAYDEEGNKRIYVPDVTFVVKGNIVGHDNESSYDVTGAPADYWTEEKVNNLKTRLKGYMDSVRTAHCTSCTGE